MHRVGAGGGRFPPWEWQAGSVSVGDMSGEASAGPMGLDEFCEALAGVLGLRPEDVAGADHLVDDLRLDDVGLFLAVVAVQGWNPWFRLPDQMDARDLGILDLHHFYVGMGEGHHEAGRT